MIVRARDEDGDLLPSSIRYPVSAGEDAEVSWLRVSPRSAGGSGGATGEAVFAVTALGVESGDAELRFTVWDERGNKASLGIPVAIWRGRPSIDAFEEETGWADGRCAARPRLDDPDLADSDQGVGESTWSLSQSEPVTDVGGSGTDEAISSTLGISPAVSGQWNGGAR